MFEEFYNSELFKLAGKSFSAGPFLVSVLLLILLTILYYFLINKFLPPVYTQNEVDAARAKKLSRNLFILIVLFFIIATLYLLDYNPILLPSETRPIKVANLFEALLIIWVARILDWVISNIFIRRYFSNRDKDTTVSKSAPSPSLPESSAAQIVTFIVSILALVLILQYFKADPELINTQIGEKPYSFRISNLLYAILPLLVGWLIVWSFTQLIMFGFYRRKRVDIGIQFAFNKLIAYVVYTIATIIALQMLGINMTLIWGGAAALLVGVGLGLQQTFNDLFSGIVLLFERTVKVGDVLEVDGVVGAVQKIGLRSSVINSRENVTFIVPNSKMTNQNVINWSHVDDAVRFQIDLGVAYGSDTELVSNLLIQALDNNPHVYKRPAPFVRFNGFGNSSLDFTLYFFSKKYMVIENIKSDIRYQIDLLFRENEVTNPIPTKRRLDEKCQQMITAF